MTIQRPELLNVNTMREFPLTITHPYHVIPSFESLLNQGANISELGNRIGAEAVTRSGSFEDTMLKSLDRVSSYQQFASNLIEASIIDPESVDVHDLTIAQSQASLALNITRNILSRVVQGWRDIINTR